MFRVFSNSKLVTSCAALLLLEEGRFALDDPVERWLPQLAGRRVLRPGATTLDDTEPARRAITIRHLLGHAAGLAYGILPRLAARRCVPRARCSTPSRRWRR